MRIRDLFSAAIGIFPRAWIKIFETRRSIKLHSRRSKEKADNAPPPANYVSLGKKKAATSPKSVYTRGNGGRNGYSVAVTAAQLPCKFKTFFLPRCLHTEHLESNENIVVRCGEKKKFNSHVVVVYIRSNLRASLKYLFPCGKNKGTTALFMCAHSLDFFFSQVWFISACGNLF